MPKMVVMTRREAHNRNTREDFWKYVEKTSLCWLWSGSLNSNGYGMFFFGYQHQRAHRAAYELAVGPIPTGKLVLHKCNIRSCVNPDHLYVGTHSDNGIDCARAGNIRQAKLTPVLVRQIRKEHKPGKPGYPFFPGVVGYKTLAKRYGVSRNAIENIISRKKWAWV